ncbi:MAG: hemerythrin domain-containing protein [Burkholderiales bacterium]|nr:hemerythrin domain-containing protein [Burkholderiales bacterium]
MTSIGDFMARSHKQCDDMFARAEQAARRDDWPSAAAEFGEFREALAQHITMEEDVLFPALEGATGMSGGGPTAVMRMEHARLRALFEQMKQALGARDAARYPGLCELLVELLRQHNAKEEGILYPMMDRVLGAEAAGLIERCSALDPRRRGD